MKLYAAKRASLLLLVSLLSSVAVGSGTLLPPPPPPKPSKIKCMEPNLSDADRAKCKDDANSQK